MKENSEVNELIYKIEEAIPNDADPNRVGDALLAIFCILAKAGNVSREIALQECKKVIDMYWDLIKIGDIAEHEDIW